ncbi:MAG: hypothetical protein J1E64_02640 [Acetatifactor sp.]|nr:hypothetical protein [Acetatifactor sp.]
MKEKLYTIPLNDAVNAQDECPFCYIERKVEQDLLDFCLGSSSSYMEADIRDMTDKAGFCRNHFQKMYTYGNTLGNAWILKTHYQRMVGEMQKTFEGFRPGKIARKKILHDKKTAANPISMWVQEKEDSCYICREFKETYARYLNTFFYLFKEDGEFREKIKNSKGFCLPHFGDLCTDADTRLNEKELKEFYDCVLPLMLENMKRVSEDVAWLVEKFDYRNKDADWKNSKDAIPRGMQKLKGGYPADPPYQMNK